MKGKEQYSLKALRADRGLTIQQVKEQYSLKALRKDRGLTIQQVSEKSGVPYSTVQAIESGRGKGFDVMTKCKLADVFEVPVFLVFPEELERSKVFFGAAKKLQMFDLRTETKKD
jgi:transcriptional regulator with XRE-family HTH domain